MTALAETLDRLGEGGLKNVSDLLTQQFKAKEQKLNGQDELAEELQLVGLEKHTLTSPAGLWIANKNRAQKLRLKKQR